MSAIFGIVNRDGRPVERVDLERMCNILAHRGPDGSNLWVNGAVGLGHRMLWTTPESLHEQLPLVNRRGDLVITADARIDNREELITTLGWNDRPASQVADSELILAAYERWGEDCPGHLLGDFAFAIWDAHEQRLFCARDHMGVKPFFYYSSDRMFVWGSEIKAIFAQGSIPRLLNEVRVADYLAGLFEDPTITFYQDVFQLPPAHTRTISRATSLQRRYWSIDPVYELRLGSDQEYAEACRTIFIESLRCRLRSAFPIGSLLSGGLDSSSITCVARDLLTPDGIGPLHTFSAIFPDLPEQDRRRIDERRYMDIVLQTGGFEAHRVRADLLSPMTKLEQMHWHQDEAFFGPNLYIHWALYSAAQQQGVRVVLDGTDGDSTVSHGWEYFPELVRTCRWKKLLTEATACALRYRISRWRIIAHMGIKPLVPSAVEQFVQSLRREKVPPWSDNRVINPAFAERIDLAGRIARLRQAEGTPARTARAMHASSLHAPLLTSTLDLADKAAAGCMIEARYPFFDRRLIEFCVSLPPDQKLSHGWDRAIMRRAMEGILPPEVQWRKVKANLSPNFQHRLLACERAKLEMVLSDNAYPISEYIDMQALRAAYQRYLQQPEHANRDALNVYSAANLAFWLQGSGLGRSLHQAAPRYRVSAHE